MNNNIYIYNRNDINVAYIEYDIKTRIHSTKKKKSMCCQLMCRSPVPRSPGRVSKSGGALIESAHSPLLLSRDSRTASGALAHRGAAIQWCQLNQAKPGVSQSTLKVISKIWKPLLKMTCSQWRGPETGNFWFISFIVKSPAKQLNF